MFCRTEYMTPESGYSSMLSPGNRASIKFILHFDSMLQAARRHGGCLWWSFCIKFVMEKGWCRDLPCDYNST